MGSPVPVVIKVAQEKRRYKDLDCALTDCLVRSQTNKIIVSKIWNKDASDATDYIIEII